MSLPTDRNPTGTPLDPLTQFNQEVLFSNAVAYTSYRLTFTNVRDNTAANSMQIAEIQLLSGGGGGGGGGGSAQLSITRGAGGSLTITSSQPGTLQSATTLTGTGTVWQNEGPINGSATVTPSGTAKFYRVIP